RGTHLGTGRVFAVHAHHRRGLRGGVPVDELEVDQRLSAVGAALLAGLDAGFAADAAALVDDEHVVADEVARHQRLPLSSSVVTRRSCTSTWSPVRSTRTADTLYSGIFD